MKAKKLLIAAVAVVVGLVVINGTRLGSHLRLWKKQANSYIQQQIPPEQEISRLRMELDNLAREDERHFHKVATQIVEVQNLEKKVARMKKDLEAREERILAMRGSLRGEDRLVTYKGEKFSRDALQTELRLAAQRFQVDEELVKSHEEQLSIRKQNLETNRKKLSELQLVRQQMKTELERLENVLVQERQAQAAEQNTLDDASYQKLRKEMDAVRDRIEVLKTKRTLKGDIDGPVRQIEKQKEQEAAIDRYLEARFGDKQ